MEAGQVIRWKRREKKLTQHDVAGRVGIGRKYLSEIERGHVLPGTRILVNLAICLDLDLNLLKIDAPGAAGDDNDEPAQ